MASKDWPDDLMSSPGVTFRPLWPAWRPAPVWPATLAEGTDKRTDELFQELDGADLHADGALWRVEVFSIVDEGEARWLQLGLTGPCVELATVQIPRGGGTAHVNLALNQWFETRRADLA